VYNTTQSTIVVVFGLIIHYLLLLVIDRECVVGTIKNTNIVGISILLLCSSIYIIYYRVLCTLSICAD
jgi:hypothetical protein